VPPLHKARGGADADAHVKAVAVHVAVEGNASPVLPVLYSVQVMLQDVEHAAQHGALLHHLVLGYGRLRVEEEAGHVLLQYFDAVGNKFGIVLESLQEPPTAVTAIVARVVAAVEKIGKQAVPHHGCRCHQHAASVVVTAGGGNQTTQRYHAVAAPRAHLACAKMGYACCERRQALERLQHRMLEEVAVEQREDVAVSAARARKSSRELQRGNADLLVL